MSEETEVRDTGTGASSGTGVEPTAGRLHLKWGEALVYAGRRDEARAQFSRAAQLDLKPSEKSELASLGPAFKSPR